MNLNTLGQRSDATDSLQHRWGIQCRQGEVGGDECQRWFVTESGSETCYDVWMKAGGRSGSSRRMKIFTEKD